MKKLLFIISTLILLTACEKDLSEYQAHCEQQALTFFENRNDITDIVFSELYRADISKDSLYTFQMLAYIRNVHNRYQSLYGTSTKHEIDGMDYSTIITVLKMYEDESAEPNTLYTEKNYAIRCNYSYTDDGTKAECLFVFNKNYQYIDRGFDR